MLRKLVAAFTVSAVMVGCTSVTPSGSGPAGAPSATASPGTVGAGNPLATASGAAPTFATGAPQPVSPTPGVTITPTAAASPAATGGQSPRDLLFSDDMSNPASGWGTGSTSGGIVAFAGGGLQLSTSANGAWLWTNRPTGRTSDTVVAVAQATPAAGGTFGLLCDSGDKQLLGAVVDTTGEWYFISIDNTAATPSATVLRHGDPGDVAFPLNEMSTMGVLCAGTATGKLRLELWMPEEGNVAMYESGDGPAGFDSVAAYGEATSDNYSILVSQLTAYGVGDGSGAMSAPARALLSHVSGDWQQGCFEEPVPAEYGTAEQTALGCFLGQPGRVGAEIAEYAAYATAEDMLSTYNNRMAAFPPDGGADSCADGSQEAGYSLDSGATEAGRLLCTPQWIGIRFEWTNNQQLILSTLIDFDGDYAATYGDWQKAGPNPGP
ncbi:MAG TPA: hypothetical protein VIK00_04950 [Candidatus Limnocylindrales bacterium]